MMRMMRRRKWMREQYSSEVNLKRAGSRRSD
jgi:hypothetical protein